MSAAANGGPEWPSIRENEDSAAPSTSGADSPLRFGFGPVASDENEATAVADVSAEARVSDNPNESRVSDNPNGNPVVRRKVKTVEDYDSMLSEFDHFASKGAGEAVGFGYEIGDMVWGKVKSHPWWPGHIYNESFASTSVQRSKRDGHVLVAFFGDSSYGWFDPAELVPFEENYAEKYRQTTSRTFVKAVEEAVDELSRRRGSGLACRCRNEFNFCPSNVEGYFVVDSGDYEPGVYSLRQINKARESFQPKEMLSFVQQLALKPMTDQHGTIEFIKNKATVLACRKAFFEEFDETYAQAFGSVPVRPPRPTEPMAVDPAKAPLSGRQVFAEVLGKGKLSVKPTKSKDQVEKEKYLFVRRDEPFHTKTKKKNSVQVGPSAHPLLVDGSGLSGSPMDTGSESHVHQASVSSISDGQHQPPSDQKFAKARKRQAGELSAENAYLDMKKKKKKMTKMESGNERLGGKLGADNVTVVEKKKRKQEIRNEGSANISSSDGSGAAMENRKKDDVAVVSSSSPVELPVVVRDLRALALDPFHGAQRNCPATTQLFFLKYRSLVYQKSLVLLPPTGNETNETHSTTLPASRCPTDRTNDKKPSTVNVMKPPARTSDDPTIGGKKRGLSDRPETIKKKKLLVGDPEKRRKLVGGSEGMMMKKKKKKIDDSKLDVVEKKIIPQKSTEFPRVGDVKETAGRTQLAKTVVKVESSKRMEQQQAVRVRTSSNPEQQQAVRVKASNNPTMLVMKFPAGAALPSGHELKAKFARFGPLDIDATRVFWKTYTCRLVYRRKVDAKEALQFALGSGNLFGSANVRCYIRDVGVEVEPEPPAKAVVHTEDGGPTQSRKSYLAAKNEQLKSCLKKPSTNDEGGNGNGRGTTTPRVKFILGVDGGEGSGGANNNEQQLLSSFPNNTTNSMDVNKNLPKFIPPLPAQFQKFPINTTTPTAEPLPARSFNAPQPTQDISQQFLNLLTRCSDVVQNVTGVLGYMPYHSL